MQNIFTLLYILTSIIWCVLSIKNLDKKELTIWEYLSNILIGFFLFPIQLIQKLNEDKTEEHKPNTFEERVNLIIGDTNTCVSTIIVDGYGMSKNNYNDAVNEMLHTIKGKEVVCEDISMGFNPYHKIAYIN